MDGLRLHWEAETPSGRRYRWAQDEPKAENVPSGGRGSSTSPGGFENADVVLPRRSGIDYSDLERLTTLRALGPGGAVAWEGRLERAPRVSGDRMAVSPSAVGWQAHTTDDQAASGVYVDRDLSRWQGASRQRRLALYAAGFDSLLDGAVQPDAATGLPALALEQGGDLTDPNQESWYDAGAGNEIASVYYDLVGRNLSASWEGYIWSASDDIATASEATADLVAGASPASAGTFTPATARRWVALILRVPGATTGTTDRGLTFRRLALFGNHGLTKRGTAPDEGYYASDVVAHAVAAFCPLLNYEEGADGTIRPSSFILPHLAFHEHTTAQEIIRQATSYGLQDWAVWENRTFWWHERGARGRNWRARVGPSQLEETGPQVDRLFNGCVVSFRDVDGTTKTAGPTGSGADTEDDTLLDSDPENPANKLGIRRWQPLQMNTSTAAGAIERGARFLEQTKLLDSSGRAQIKGWVEDDRGVTHPYWRVRAGDTISFVDAADTSPRRIVKADHDYEARSCSVDLDAPPDGMDALLNRLDVVLKPIGF